MVTSTQEPSLATVTPMPVMKRISTTFMTGYVVFLNTFRDNSQFICGEVNVQIGKDENNKFGLHNLPNRNDKCLTYFPLRTVFHG